MRVGVAHQLVRPLGRGIQRNRLIHPVGLPERHLGVRAVDRRRAGIDQMPQRRQPPRRLQHHQMTHHVGLHIGIRIHQRMPHPGLRRQMHDRRPDPHDPATSRPTASLSDTSSWWNAKPACATQPVQPRLLQPHIIIVVQVVQADHAVAARQQRLGDMVADEPGAAGDQDLHGSGRATRRSSSSSSTA